MTRVGGVSEGPYASLNLGGKSGDEPERADENRRIACEAIGGDVEKLALNYQVHSARVLRAVPALRGEHADGLWTSEPGLPILAMSVHCLRIVLARAGADEPAVAVLHAGWKGLLAGIVSAAGAEALGPGPPTAAIGPGIGPCCYEVGVPRAAVSASPPATTSCATAASTSRRARSARSAPPGWTLVDRLDRCTACEPETFFSHRRDAGGTGRQGVIAYVAAGARRVIERIRQEGLGPPSRSWPRPSTSPLTTWPRWPRWHPRSVRTAPRISRRSTTATAPPSCGTSSATCRAGRRRS